MKKSFIIILLFSVVFVASSAQQKSDVLSLLKKKYSAQSIIKAEIQLKVWWDVREKEEIKKGDLLLAPSDKFRINLGNEVYVCDGATIYQYHKITKLLQIKNLRDINPSMLPSYVIKSFISNYPLKVISQSDKETVLSWIADSTSSSIYKSVEISADNKNCIKLLKLTDNNGNVFSYTFSKTEFAGSVPKGAFKFEIPSDAQVNDAR